MRKVIHRCLICGKEIPAPPEVCGTFANPLDRICDKCSDNYGYLISVAMTYAAVERIKEFRREQDA